MMDTHLSTAYVRCTCGVCYKLHQVAYSLTYTNSMFRLVTLRVDSRDKCKYCKRVLPKPTLERKGWK